MRSRSRGKSLLFACLTLASAYVVCAQQFWEKKNYRNWSKDECQKLLADSPWAKEFKIEKTTVELLQETSPADRSRVEEPWVRYRIQFRSALPVRQAVARLSAIESKYDGFSQEQKLDFDTKAEKYISTVFPDTILVHVSYESNVTSYEGDLARYWHNRTPGQMQSTAFLMNSRGAKVELARYVPGGGTRPEFDLYFPRQINGQPVLLPEDKNVSVELMHPAIGSLPSERIFLEFRTAKMSVAGQLIY
jgi:hypothetical protein